MTKCKSCKSETTIIHDFGKLPLANSLGDKPANFKKYNLALVLCKSCLLVQTKHNLKKEIIFHKEYPYLSSTSKSSLDLYKNFVIKLCKKFDSKKKFIIEIGSNDGYLLQYFKEKKTNLLGIEPSKFAAKIANAKGVTTINNFFSYDLSHKIVTKYKKADILIANNVFAHIENLNDFIKGMENILSDKGILIIEFQYLCKVVEDGLYDNIYHEHYLYYTLHSIIEVLKRYKLDVFDCEKINTHGGSLRIYVMKSNNNKIKTKRMKDILKDEIKKNVKKIKYYKNISKNIYQKINHIKLFFKNIKKTNKHIAGFGAAAKTSSVLNFCNVDFKTIDLLFDKSKTKQNKFLSGTGIKIIEPSKIKINKYDVVVIFIWNLKDEVLKYLKYLKINKKIDIYILHPYIKKLKIK